MVTQTEIARRAGLDVSSVNKILNRRHDFRFGKRTITRVLRVAKRLGFDFQRLKHAHQRRKERIFVDLRAELFIYFRRDHAMHARGQCTIRDLSISGACISDISLPLRSLPLEPYSVGLRPKPAAFKRRELRGHFVRSFVKDGVTCIGIEFESSSPAGRATGAYLSRLVPAGKQ